ncbi:MAG: biotin synthase BioB, partial [Gammaproteobacteria bacterium]
MNTTIRPDDTVRIRNDWSRKEIQALFEKPLMDLLFEAQTIHRATFDPNAVQVSTLLSIKTGSCPEDCGYCPQSAHHNSELQKEPLMDVDFIVSAARRAKANGSSRFCMGAAWRNPNKRDFPKVIEIVKAVRAEGLETCMTLGMLTPEQSDALADAGLDYYNHNLDTSPEFYEKIITTRTYQDRLDTLANVRDAGINVCCGGIVGMGEDESDRVGLLMELANLPRHPESVPINNLVKVEGTP